MRGSSKKKKAKITEINLKNSKVALEGIQRSKKDGTKISIFFNPRALQVVTLVTDDKERLNALNKTKLKENASNKTANNN